MTKRKRITCKFEGGPADGLRFWIVMPAEAQLALTGEIEIVGPAPSVAKTVYAPRTQGRTLLYRPRRRK